MVDKKRILKNLATLSFSEIINKGVILITSLYLMRQILPEGTGIVNYADSYSSFFIIIVILAFSSIGTREIAKNQFEIPKIVNTILTSRIILALLGVIVYIAVLFSLNLDTETRNVTAVYAIILFTNAINLDWAFQGMERMGVLATRQVFTSLLTLVGYLLLVHSRADVINAALISTLSGLLNVVLLFVYYNKKEYKFRFSIDREVLNVIFKSIIPLSIFVFSVTLLNKANMLIMESYGISKHDMGIFAGAFKFINFGLVPSGIIQMSFFQLLSRTSDSEERKKVYDKYFTLNLLTGCFVFLLLFLLPELITFTLKKDFAESIPILKIYIISGIIMYMNTSVTPALIAWNHEKKIMNATIIGSICSLVANLIFIKLYGIYGAVYASIIGETIIFSVYALYLYQVIKYNFIRSIFKIFSVFVLSLLVGITLQYFNVSLMFVIPSVVIMFYSAGVFFKLVNINEIVSIIRR